MVHMTLDMPEETLAALRTDPENFARQLRLAAAVIVHVPFPPKGTVPFSRTSSRKSGQSP